MASWTTQDPNSLLPGEPWTSAKALAAFENPTAIAEGATGAPKIRTVALQPPTAGSTYIRRMNDFGTGAFDSTISPQSAKLDEGSIAVLVGGTIRVVSTIATSGTVTFTVSFKKNGTTFASYTTTGLKFTDVAVGLGDKIEIEISASTGSGGSNSVTLSDVRIESGSADFAVA